MLIEPKAVIFDYGNVLCAPQQPSDLQAIAAMLDLSEAEFLPLYWRYRIDYDAARMDAAGFWHGVLQSVSPAQIARLVELDIASWMRPNPPMLDWARRLREAGLKTALLSNMPKELRDYLMEQVAWMPAFDQVTFSCDVRICKPDSAIYQHCLGGLGVAAGEALFLDDREDNVRGAQEVGIHALLFTDAPAAWRQIAGKYHLPD